MLLKNFENRAHSAQALNKKYQEKNAFVLLKAVSEEEFRYKNISLVSSFGVESGVLLHMVSQINKDFDVIFLDTFKHFDETYRYRDELIKLLGLRSVRIVKPEAQFLKGRDPDSTLFAKNPDQCCYLRRVLPLEKALQGRDVWISGRKHFQSEERSNISLFEETNGKIKVNPLIKWTHQEIDAYFEKYHLPRHPLVEKGYFSIGCAPCTAPTWLPDQARVGRWNGSNKTECGIHFEQSDNFRTPKVLRLKPRSGSFRS